MGTQRELEQVRASVAEVEGWFTDDQVEALWRAARALPPGSQVVEIGSFRGRSTIVLASAVPEGTTVVAIDPHAGNDRGPQEIEGFEAEAADDFTTFHANLAAAGVAPRVRHVRATSDAAHDSVDGPLALLHIDGAHRFGPARRDIVEWGDRVQAGGLALVHDSFSSIGVTLALLTTWAWSPQWRLRGRAGSLATYQRVPAMGPGAWLADLVRHGAQLPWFARNVVVKAAIVARQRWLARLLGHDGETWPH